MPGQAQRDSRRGRVPIDLGPAGTADSPLGDRLPEATWIEPIPDAHVMSRRRGSGRDLQRCVNRSGLAFVAALQHLAPKQRAVLILRDVLKWKASEVADLLGTTVAAVNSALQRARATMANTEVRRRMHRARCSTTVTRCCSALYVDAFERYDMDALTSLLHRDATWTMPPYELWLNTHEDIRRWCLGRGIGCRGSRLVPVKANASPAFAQYKPAADGGFDAWSLQVLEIAGGKIAGICFFLDVEWLFPLFGLPPRLPVESLSMGPRLVKTDEFAAPTGLNER